MLLLSSSEIVPRSGTEGDLLIPLVHVVHASWARSFPQLSSWRTLPPHRRAVNKTAVATAQPSPAASVPSPDSKAPRLQCVAERGAGVSRHCQEIRSALSGTLEGILLFEEVRTESHVGRTGEEVWPCQNTGSSEPASPE